MLQRLVTRPLTLAIRNNPACVDICRPIVFVEGKHSQRRSFNFSMS